MEAQKITEIKRTTDVKETIEEFLKNSDDYVGVILMAVDKNHAPIMVTSTMENYQKTYLKAFHDKVSNDMFSGARGE